MTRYLAVSSLQRDSLLPEDEAVNTWAFESNSLAPVQAQMEAIVNGIGAFFNPLGNYFSVVLTGQLTCRVYDIDDPEPRVPLYTDTGNVFSPAGSAVPEECAVCLSFRGQIGSGDNPRRRKGRLYLGPLSGNAFDYGTSPTKVTVDGTFISDIEAAQQAAQTIWSAENTLHAVWSRADDNLYDVVEYWVDNAPDTQRRRGPRASSRTTWPWVP